jgi:hypothetical protein
MDELIAIIEANGGYLMRHQLNDLGYSDASIRALVRERVLRRERHGTYVARATWAARTDAERHLVIARSVLDKLGPGFAASHQTAAAAHGFDLYGSGLDDVHLVRLDGGSGRREAGVVYHHGAVDDADIVMLDDVPVVSARRAVFDTCVTSGVESGMVVASSAMNSGRLSREELVDEAERHPHWLGARTARLAIRLSDERLESVGETRSLFMMWKHHVPRPEMQVVVRDRDGIAVARVDFDWSAYCHTGEFDGKVKYGRLNPHSHDPGQVLVEEKDREDKVRDTQRGMSRWVWAELASKVQAELGARIRRGLEQSRRVYGRNATHIV